MHTLTREEAAMEDRIRVLGRAFDILEALSAASVPMTLSEIAGATGLSKSTVHRILAALLDRSYVFKYDSGSYTIGFKLVEIAGTHINNLELITEAAPYLSKITRVSSRIRPVTLIGTAPSNCSRGLRTSGSRRHSST